MNKQQSTIARLTETACVDKPARPSVIVQDGRHIITFTGNRDRWNELCRTAGVPAGADQTIGGDTLTVAWDSHADKIFGPAGTIASRLPNYEMRPQQLQMARIVQRAIEMGVPAVIEGSTGTGKSLAYLAPALAMGKRIVVSTSNRALQMQLFKKDAPSLLGMFPGKTVELAVGKNNYACRNNVEGLGANLKLSQPLRDWYETTETGNTEEITFAVSRQELASITVDDDCAGRACPFFYECHYYRAKDARKTADVVITNHALLCLNEMYPGAGILPTWDVLVVDEAHKLPDYARNVLGAEFSLSSVGKAIEVAQPYVTAPARIDEATGLLGLLDNEVKEFLRGARNVKSGKNSPQVALGDHVFGVAQILGETLDELADEVWSDSEMPTDSDERKRARRAARIRSLGDRVKTMAEPGELVRWIEPNEPVTLKAAPADVSEFVASIAGVTAVTTPVTSRANCARCGRALTSARVAVVDDRAYGPECVKYVDPLGDAEYIDTDQWLASEAGAADSAPVAKGKATIFCSATLATPTLASFMREAGIPDALRMVAGSPFDYESNTIMYLPSAGVPSPDDKRWRDWAVSEIETLVTASGGGAFLLFTSYDAMNYAASRLRPKLKGMTVLVQNELPKLELARRFRADGNAVLFATKSFFEGVSIDGSALRLVIIDKLPFAAPNPLTDAIVANATEHGRTLGYSGRKLSDYVFTQAQVSPMVIELKQAVGRLIRTATDRGAIAILDNRIRATEYGRKLVMPSLPPSPKVARVDAVADWLRNERRPKREPIVMPEMTPAMRKLHEAWPL